MAATKHKKTLARVSPSATKKPTSKKVVSVKARASKKLVKKVGVLKKIAAPLKKKAPEGASRTHVQKVVDESVMRPTPISFEKKVIPVSLKPNAQTCPLVLDGIVLIEDFSPRDCFSCDEFDCRFYVAEERSGVLGSRLCPSEEEGDEDLEDADLFGFDRGEDDDDHSDGEEDNS